MNVDDRGVHSFDADKQKQIVEVTDDELQVLEVLDKHNGVWMSGRSEDLAANTRDRIGAKRVDATWKGLFAKKLVASTIDGPVIDTLGRRAVEQARREANTNQITRSKSRLRAQIRELQDELDKVNREPIRQKLARIEQELATIRKHQEAIEDVAVAMIEQSIVLARLVSSGAE